MYYKIITTKKEIAEFIEHYLTIRLFKFNGWEIEDNRYITIITLRALNRLPMKVVKEIEKIKIKSNKKGRL